MVRKLLEILIAVAFVAGLSGCDNSDGLSGSSSTSSSTTTTTTTTTATPTQLIIGTDKVQVLSDGSDSATITVTALDASNVVVAGANVIFSAPSGQLDASVVTTGSDGTAVVHFSAGTGDPTNQTVTITADAGGGVTSSIPVQVAGSTVQFAATGTTQLTIGGTDTATLTLTAANSAGVPVYNIPVTVSIDSSSTATGQLDPTGTAAQTYTANTDPNGQITVDIKGLTAGNLVVAASALGASANKKTLTVVTATTALHIASPTDLSQYQINTGGTVTITVPSGISDVTMATSLGNWVTVNGTSVNSSSYTATGVGGTTINATINSSETGVATILVFDANNVSVTDSIKIAFVNTTVDANSNITLQAAKNTVPISVGDTTYSVTLTGRVTDASNNAITSAPVSLSLQNQPGGGEYLDPPYVFTDASGSYTTTFTSGSIGSDSNGVDVVATLMGNGKTATANIIITQTAGSVVIGRSTKVASINSDTAYDLPMSVQVSDANGSPVANATVSLKIWPKRYSTGYWVTDGAVYTGTFDNEDANRNLILDSGEDQSFVEGALTPYTDGTYYYNADVNYDGDGNDVIGGDNKLTPPNTAAGGVPASVTTDANGLGTFDLIYLKASAAWITAEVTASVQVQGTESTGVLTFALPALKSDVSGGVLPDSPYNMTADASFSPSDIGMGGAGVGAMSSSNIVSVSGGTTLTVKVVDTSLTPVSGANVSLSFDSQGSNGTNAPSLSVTTVTTGSNGTATATYTAGDQAGLDVIKVQYTDGTNIYTNYIRINVQ